MKSITLAAMVALIALTVMAQNPSPGSAPSPAKRIGMFAYPKNHQAADQQLKDENQCYGSAEEQTGIDPQAPPPAAPSAQEQQDAQKQAAQPAGKEVPSSPWRNCRTFVGEDEFGGSKKNVARRAPIDGVSSRVGETVVLRPIRRRKRRQNTRPARFLSSRGVPAPSSFRRIRLRLNAPT